MRAQIVLSILALAAVCPARAALTLAADDAPTDPPWKKPATISYVRQGDGSTNATVDAVLRYKITNTPIADKTAKVNSYAFGAYVHRDNDSAKPKNDRGVSASLGQLIVADSGSNAGGPYSFNWNAKVKLGKAIEEFKDDSLTTQRADRTKDRLLLQLSGYYQLPIVDKAPPRPGSKGKPDAQTYFDGSIGCYSDHSYGGSGKGSGRLTGVMMGASVNWAPFGLDPAAEFNKVGGLGFVPTVRAAAQVQRDLADSGTRTKDTYKLYTLELSLAFSKLSGDGVVPTLNLSRTVGADLLNGRAKDSKTELSLGLSF